MSSVTISEQSSTTLEEIQTSGNQQMLQCHKALSLGRHRRMSSETALSALLWRVVRLTHDQMVQFVYVTTSFDGLEQLKNLFQGIRGLRRDGSMKVQIMCCGNTRHHATDTSRNTAQKALSDAPIGSQNGPGSKDSASRDGAKRPQ